MTTLSESKPASAARSAGPRYIFPVLVGKLARFATRLRGGGGALPGYLTNKLAPSLLSTLANQFGYGVVFVLGSNGKTTTTHMISEILRAHGLNVFTNPTGANLPQGVTSALLADATLTGRVRADVAVLEVDEGYAAELADVLAPSVILSLNVQVDQLYRFYETERVADMMLDASSRASGHVVINRDDAYLSKIDEGAMQGSGVVLRCRPCAGRSVRARPRQRGGHSQRRERRLPRGVRRGHGCGRPGGHGGRRRC